MSDSAKYQREWRGRNREKQKDSQRKWAAKNPAKHREGENRRSRQRAQRRRELLNKLKARPCMDCGGVFPPCCMDFDHRDRSTKIDIVSKVVSFPGGFDALLAEIDKCDLVCANCHRIRTFERNHNKERVQRDAPRSNQLSLIEGPNEKAA